MYMKAEEVLKDAALLEAVRREPLELQQGEETFVLLRGDSYERLLAAWEQLLGSRAQTVLAQNREAFEELAK